MYIHVCLLLITSLLIITTKIYILNTHKCEFSPWFSRFPLVRFNDNIPRVLYMSIGMSIYDGITIT